MKDPRKMSFHAIRIYNSMTDDEIFVGCYCKDDFFDYDDLVWELFEMWEKLHGNYDVPFSWFVDNVEQLTDNEFWVLDENETAGYEIEIHNVINSRF